MGSVQETELWNGLASGKINIKDAVHTLNDISKYSPLSHVSKEFLSLSNDVDKQHYIDNNTIIDRDEITYLTKIKREANETSLAENLILSTEHGYVILMDATGLDVLDKIKLISSIPTHICCYGSLDLDMKIFVATRDGSIFLITSFDSHEKIIKAKSPICEMVIMNKFLAIATLNSEISVYDFNGEKQYRVYLPVKPREMVSMHTFSNRSLKCLITALVNNEVRLYNGKSLLWCYNANAIVTGLYFGKYGRAENSLIIIKKNKSLEIKILDRNADFEPNIKFDNKCDNDVDQKLKFLNEENNILKEQKQRELEKGPEIYFAYQKQIQKLKLRMAKTFLKVRDDGLGNMSTGLNLQITIHVNVKGLGPNFKILIELINNEKKALNNITICFQYNCKIYKLIPNKLHMPMMVPDIKYIFSVKANCLQIENSFQNIGIFLIHSMMSRPIVSALVKLSCCESLDFFKC